MDKEIELLLSDLSDSPTELSEKNKKKIHTYIPVPFDFEILWADINSFGGFPSGVVLTNKGLVLKAPRPTFKDKKKERDKEKIYRIPYQIILWDYFDPTDYEIVKSVEGNSFTLKQDGKILSVFQDASLLKFLTRYSDYLARIDDYTNLMVENAVWSEVENLNMENAAFNAAYGENQSKTGHGIYAEEVGSVLDKLSGEKSTVVGRDNAKNGPDKIVNGSPVQCKFCKSAGSSVGACFKKNPETGKLEYRYFEAKTGAPMKVEVPADQYEKAVEAMKQRILNNQVPGVNDPEKASELIRKSKLTYAQAKNLAKAGTFESLTYDAATGAINCGFAAGISSLASFGMTYWQTSDIEKSKDAAVDTAIGVFGPALAASIITNQIARTGLSNALKPASQKIANKIGTKTVQKLINARRALIGKGKIYGSAANKSFAKALRSNVIVEGVSFVAFSIPDTYRVFSKKISGAQYTKNMLSSFGSLLGGIASTYGAGVAAGKVGEKIGKKVNKKVGAVIGFVAGAGGGMVAGFAVKKLSDMFKEDDCIITARMFNAVVVNMAIEYMLDEAECDELIKILDSNSKEISKMQIKILKSERQYFEIKQFLESYYETVVVKRKRSDSDLENKALNYAFEEE